jgi:hypothetical protein
MRTQREEDEQSVLCAAAPLWLSTIRADSLRASLEMNRAYFDGKLAN